MDGRHDPFFHADSASEDLNNRCDTVSCATCTGDQASITIYCINTMDYCWYILTPGRCGENDVFGSGLNMFRHIISFCKCPSTLQHNVHPELGPRQPGRVFFIEVWITFS